MQPIRVLLGPIPPLPGAIIREPIELQRDIQVSEVGKGESLVDAARRCTPDVILAWGGANATALRDEVRRTLEVVPRAMVLTIMADGIDVVLHELRPVAESLGELAPKDLVRAIRSVTRRWDSD